MIRRLLVITLALMAMALLTANAFGQACSGGAALQFVGSGANAQFNTFAYAAVNIVSQGTFNTSAYNLSSSKAAVLADTRFTGTAGSITDSTQLWVVWDENTTCNVYAYYGEDAAIGTKNFFVYKPVLVNGKTFSVAAEYPPTNTSLGTFGANKVNGLADTTSTVPATVITALTTPPVPTSSTDTPHAHGLNYCGYAGTGGKSSSGVWCYFNAVLTDGRPEDDLFATTRALSSIPSAGGLTGLGYNQAACLAGTDAPGSVATQGCPVVDSFGQNKWFNVLAFGLTKDPITLSVPPAYTTIATGAAPIVVFVGNDDSSNPLGFGSQYQDNNSNSHYTFTDINRATLASIFNGTLNCTGDLLPGTPVAGNNPYDNGFIAGPPPGSGQPIQVVTREPLAGTYNTFEYTAVRQLTGSSNGLTAKPTSTAWVSDEDSGQEFSPTPVTYNSTTVYANNPATSFSANGCPAVTLNAGVTAAPTAGSVCGDPLFLPTGTAGVACGQGLRLRALSSGEHVEAVVAKLNLGGSVVTDGIGYSFWSYGNFGSGNKIVSGCSQNNSTGTYTCSANIGHYLAVDGIDPLFNTPGGELDYGTSTIYINGTATSVPATNPAGAYNLPQCGFYFYANPSVNSGNTESCFKIPFTHVYDGKYPLWNLYRLDTLANVGTGTGQTLAVPQGVINIVASAESEANDSDISGTKKALSDFVPLFTSITDWSATNLYTQGSTSLPKGNLNLGVFRAHYKETNNPANGHVGCLSGGVYNFTNVNLAGGNPSGATCLVDHGGDFGGSVFTVQGDADFNADYGSTAGHPVEIYNLHQ
jgi:hypothetical protein